MHPSKDTCHVKNKKRHQHQMHTYTKATEYEPNYECESQINLTQDDYTSQ